MQHFTEKIKKTKDTLERNVKKVYENFKGKHKINLKENEKPQDVSRKLTTLQDTTFH